ncbi:MAG: HEPN domain-containing protein [Saprospiraceae bacterium]
MEKHTSVQFLEVAQHDLAAAQLLYDHKFYSQAIFFLQQSIEKTMKAIGLITEIVEFEQLASHQVGHRAYKIQRIGGQLLLDKVAKILNSEESHPTLLYFIPLPKQKLIEFQNEIHHSIKIIGGIHPENYAELSSETYKELFHSFEETAAFRLEISVEEFCHFMAKYFQNLYHKGLISNDVNTALVSFFKEEENVLRMIDGMEKALQIELWMGQVLSPLSIITSAHEADSRYPDPETDWEHHPVTYYQAGLPIVDHLKELIHWQNKALGVVRNIF